MGSLAQNDSDDCSNERSLFVGLADTIVELGQSAGVKIFPYRDKRVPWFMAMASADRQKVVSELQVFVDICQDCLAMGGSLTNSRSLVWCALKRLGLQQGSDLFTFITDEQVIEIYSYEQVQIFRNFNFFRYVGSVGKPLGIETNLYNYTFSDPVNFIDPEGMAGQRMSMVDGGAGYPPVCDAIRGCHQFIEALKYPKYLIPGPAGLVIKCFLRGLSYSCEPTPTERQQCDLPEK